MHKNVNLNQFSIIQDQKKIVGKDDPSILQFPSNYEKKIMNNLQEAR